MQCVEPYSSVNYVFSSCRHAGSEGVPLSAACEGVPPSHRQLARKRSCQCTYVQGVKYLSEERMVWMSLRAIAKQSPHQTRDAMSLRAIAKQSPHQTPRWLQQRFARYTLSLALRAMTRGVSLFRMGLSLALERAGVKRAGLSRRRRHTQRKAIGEKHGTSFTFSRTRRLCP